MSKLIIIKINIFKRLWNFNETKKLNLKRKKGTKWFLTASTRVKNDLAWIFSLINSRYNPDSGEDNRLLLQCCRSVIGRTQSAIIWLLLLLVTWRNKDSCNGLQYQSVEVYANGDDCALILNGPGRTTVFDYTYNLLRGSL